MYNQQQWGQQININQYNQDNNQAEDEQQSGYWNIAQNEVGFNSF